MKKFQEYIKEANRPNSDVSYDANGRPVPGGHVMDRSLEGFKYLMDQLQIQMKGVQDPIAKQALQPIVNEFYAKMREALVGFNKQGIGYSPRYQPRKNPMGGVE
jgi:hypothetical protein